MRVFRMGDELSVTCEGRTLPATVVLASPNGRALVLEFEGVLGSYVGTMPALWTEAKGWCDLFKNLILELEDGGN